MKHAVSALIVLLLLSVAPVLAEPSSPESVCNDFMSAMQAHDWKKAYGYFSKKLQQKTPYEGWALVYESYAPRFTIETWKVEVKENGDKASGKIVVTSKGEGDESTNENPVDLAKEDGEWRISAYH